MVAETGCQKTDCWAKLAGIFSVLKILLFHIYGFYQSRTLEVCHRNLLSYLQNELRFSFIYHFCQNVYCF